MKRIFIFLSVLCFIRCNEAKSIDIDSAKSPVGVLLNIVLPEILHAGRPAGPEFLAVGENCSLLTSEDGETWTVQQGASTPFSGCSGGVIYGVAQGNGRWVAVGTLSSNYLTYVNNCGIWSSVDGVTWERHSCPTSGSKNYPNSPLRSLAFGQVAGIGLFIASGHKMGTGTGEDYYGIMSLDGINWRYRKIGPTPAVDGGLSTTCYLSFDASSAHCTGETGSYNDAIFKLNSASGTWVADTNLPDYIGYADLPDPPPNYRPRTYWFYHAASNNYRFSFGQGDSANYISRKIPGTAWDEVVSNEVVGDYGVLMTSAADAGGALVALGDRCTWMRTADMGTNWTTYLSLGNCAFSEDDAALRIDWSDLAYNPYVKKFVGVGTFGAVVASETADSPESWNIDFTPLSGRINSLVSKP